MENPTSAHPMYCVIFHSPGPTWKEGVAFPEQLGVMNHIQYMDQLFQQREIIWQKKINMRVYGSALAKDDIIYFGAFNGKVYGIDYLTGITKWIFQTESSKLNYNVMYNEKDEFKEGFSLYAQGFEKA